MPAPVMTGDSIAANVLAWYPGYPGTGTTLEDCSGVGPDVTLNGSVGWTTLGGLDAMDFPATSGSYAEANASILNPGDGDWTAAVRFRVDGYTTQRTILQQLDGTGTGRSWLYITTGGLLRTFIGGSTLTVSGALTAGVDYTAVLTVDSGGSVRIYLDGALAAGPASRSVESNVSLLRIGADKSGSNRFDGVIGEIVLLDRAWSDAEAAAWDADPMALYDAGGGSSVVPLVVHHMRMQGMA